MEKVIKIFLSMSLIFVILNDVEATSIYGAGNIGLTFETPDYVQTKQTAFNYGASLGMELGSIPMAFELFLQLVVSGYVDTAYRGSAVKHDFADNIYGMAARYYLSVFDAGLGVVQHNHRQSLKDVNYNKVWEKNENEINWFWLIGFRLPFPNPRVDLYFDYMYYPTKRSTNKIEIILVGVRFHAVF